MHYAHLKVHDLLDKYLCIEENVFDPFLGHNGPENLKKSGPKILDQIPFFSLSKLAKNQFLNWENV